MFIQVNILSNLKKWDLFYKPGSYFVQMRTRYECWRHKFATNNLQQFNSAQLTCKYRCERRVVTLNSRQIRFAFTFAGSMNRALHLIGPFICYGRAVECTGLMPEYSVGALPQFSTSHDTCVLEQDTKNIASLHPWVKWVPVSAEMVYVNE